jgi:hypothetical protein
MFILTFTFSNAEIISGLNASVGKIVNYNLGQIDHCISQLVSLYDNNPQTPIYAVYMSYGSSFNVSNTMIVNFDEYYNYMDTGLYSFNTLTGECFLTPPDENGLIMGLTPQNFHFSFALWGVALSFLMAIGLILSF